MPSTSNRLSWSEANEDSGSGLHYRLITLQILVKRSAVVELETDNYFPSDFHFLTERTDGQLFSTILSWVNELQQTHQSSVCNNPGSTRSSGHIDDSMTAVEHQRWTHRWHRHLAGLDVVAWRRYNSERVDSSGNRKVIDLVVEDYSGSLSTNCWSETISIRQTVKLS